MSGVVTRSRAKSQPQLPARIPKLSIFDSANPSEENSFTGNFVLQEGSLGEKAEMSCEENQQKNTNGENPVNQNENENEKTTKEKWLDMFNNLNSTLTQLKTQVSDLAGIKTQVSMYSEYWKDSVDKSLIDIDEKQDKQELKICLLTNIAINQEEKINMLEQKLTAAYEREIKPNLILNGLIEEGEETRTELKDKLDSLFKETMEITQDIELNDWFQMGDGHTRSVMIKLKHALNKVAIFGNTGKLKDKFNSKNKAYYINDDQSDAQSEFRRGYKELVQENKKKAENEKLKIKIAKGKLLINNEVVKQQVTVPSFLDVLRLDDDELDKVRATRLIKGTEHVEKGSEYFTYACKVKLVHKVTQAYKIV